MIRHAAVAGQFYPSDPVILKRQLEKFMPVAKECVKALGIVVPHAGYIYSGAVAGAVYARVEIPNTVIILGPNHHGIGSKAAIYPPGEWDTPLGNVAIEQQLSKLILQHASFVEEDSTAHHYEHSLEVQVPFLQHVKPDISIVPLCLGFGDYASSELLGRALAKAIKDFKKEVLVVASSDMSHYEPVDVARHEDNYAIQEMLNMNPEGMYSTVRNRGITMCGIIPATVMLIAAMDLGASKSELIRYATSGDVSGDFQQVVGYAGLMVY
ncbi:MAG TPA: AmmeMemoRadiSam system protein B [Alphaproteobacteria bacterium]|nr:AmmeMemoRadiSam system protein B [Alphaproteobacteria bacterium]